MANLYTASVQIHSPVLHKSTCIAALEDLVSARPSKFEPAPELCRPANLQAGKSLMEMTAQVTESFQQRASITVVHPQEIQTIKLESRSLRPQSGLLGACVTHIW